MIGITAKAVNIISGKGIVVVALANHGDVHIGAGIEEIELGIYHHNSQMLGTYPDFAVTHLLDVKYTMSTNRICSDVDESLGGDIEDIQSMLRAYPDNSIAILINRTYFITGNGRWIAGGMLEIPGRAILGIYHGKTFLYMTAKYQSVA